MFYIEKLNRIIKPCISVCGVLIPMLFIIGPSNAQKKDKAPNDKNNSVRKAPLVVVGDHQLNYTANADEVNTYNIARPSEELRLGIQYYPAPGVDRGPALLKERKFKWRAYYHLKTRVDSLAVVDYLHHIHAIAAVAGDGFAPVGQPNAPSCQSGSKNTDYYANLGPYGSVNIKSFDMAEKNPYLEQIIKCRDVQVPIHEATPTVESLYKDVTGIAVADCDGAWASEVTAQATMEQETLPANDERQWSVGEAFYYPYSAR